MHEINWSLYYIPKTHNEKVKHLTDEELMNIKKSKALVNNLYIKMNTDKNYEDKNKENENNSNNILFIPQHNSINNAIYPKEEKKQEKLKISKEDIDGIRKLGIITHSFDENIEQNFQDKEKEQSLNNEQ